MCKILQDLTKNDQFYIKPERYDFEGGSNLQEPLVSAANSKNHLNPLNYRVCQNTRIRLPSDLQLGILLLDHHLG